MDKKQENKGSKSCYWSKPSNLSDKWKDLELKTASDLTIATWNVRGLGCELSRMELKRILETLDIDIIGVTDVSLRIEALSVMLNKKSLVTYFSYDCTFYFR